MSKELKPCPGYEGLYSASPDGFIYSHYSVPARSLAAAPNSRGYLHVQLAARGGISKSWLVHRLILLTFRGPPQPGQQSRHLNGKNDDNRLENLAWGTTAENQRDKVLHGTNGDGERNSIAKLTDRTVKMIPGLMAVGLSSKQVATALGVDWKTVRDVLSGRTWKHISRAQPKPVAVVVKLPTPSCYPAGATGGAMQSASEWRDRDWLNALRAAGVPVEGQPAEPSTGWDSPGPTP